MHFMDVTYGSFSPVLFPFPPSWVLIPFVVVVSRELIIAAYEEDLFGASRRLSSSALSP